MFHKTPVIFPHSSKKRQTVQSEDAIEDTAYKPGFENFKFYNKLLSLSSSLLCDIGTTMAF
jgi:hypothetical protein